MLAINSIGSALPIYVVQWKRIEKFSKGMALRGVAKAKIGRCKNAAKQQEV